VNIILETRSTNLRCGKNRVILMGVENVLMRESAVLGNDYFLETLLGGC